MLWFLRPKKMFVSSNGAKENRVGRLVKKNLDKFFCSKKCVFYECFKLIGSWEGGKL